MMPDNPASDDKQDGYAKVADQPAQPRRRSSSVQKIYSNASGIPDLFVEGEAARQVRRGKRPAVDLSAYRGHERISVANLEDD